MVLSTIGFVFWRFMEIITLIPTMGMLAYFVNGYVNNNLLTPTYILLLFIVSVLALAWSLFTLFSYHRSASSAKFVSLIDLGFLGTFIASAYLLRFIASANCSSITTGDSYDISFGIFGSYYGNSLGVSTDKTCAMLKACWVFAIMNCVFFAFTAVLAWLHASHVQRESRYRRETTYHTSRRSGTSRSVSARRRGSHHSSRRSSHSHRRTYV